MSIWGGITGGLLGFVVLGPIGALVGSVIGSNLSSRSKRKRPNNFDKQVAFFAAFIDLLFNQLSLGETTIRSFRPKLCITRATIPIFSGSWGLTKIMLGFFRVNFYSLNH